MIRIPITEKKPIFRVVTIDDAKFQYRPNFRGEGSRYNKEGNRNFNVRIEEPELIERLSEEPWNLKYTKVSDDYPEANAYLNVTLDFHPMYDNYLPHVYVRSEGKVVAELFEDDIHKLDEYRIRQMSLVIRPRVYPDDLIDNIWKIKAYVKALYVEFDTDDDDPYAERYSLKEFKERNL